MGSIASVLQWHCSECALINPTESARCARCGLTRLRSDERVGGHDDRASTIAAERSGSARQEGAGARERRSTRGREDGECPRALVSSSTSGESTPPTPPPRTDKLAARNPTDTSLPVGQRGESRRAVTNGSERYLSACEVKKNLHCGSWNGSSSERIPLKRFSSLPSLITQWTCIRCLLDNNCSSLICAACDASASIAQIDGKKIGARKSKKINLHKENRLKSPLDF